MTYIFTEPQVYSLVKAFDKVSHHQLLQKLENYGIKGNILDWTSTTELNVSE